MSRMFIEPISPIMRHYPTITPFTYRDGATYAQTLEHLVEVMGTLIDDTNTANDALYDTVIATLNTKISEINDLLNTIENTP